jgi:hypothetical protein
VLRLLPRLNVLRARTRCAVPFASFALPRTRITPLRLLHCLLPCRSLPATFTRRAAARLGRLLPAYRCFFGINAPCACRYAPAASLPVLLAFASYARDGQVDGQKHHGDKYEQQNINEKNHQAMYARCVFFHGCADAWRRCINNAQVALKQRLARRA